MLDVLVLSLSSLVISVACASSGASSEPKPPQRDSGENWARAGPSELPTRLSYATAVQTARLASQRQARIETNKPPNPVAPPRRAAASREE